MAGLERRPTIESSLFSIEISKAILGHAGHLELQGVTSKFAAETFRAFGLFSFGRRTLALAGDREHAVMQRNIDVFLAHSGDLDDCDDVVRVLIKVESRRPAAKELCLTREITRV